MDSRSQRNSRLHSPIHHVGNARGKVVIKSPQNTTVPSRPSISREGSNIIYKESREANNSQLKKHCQENHLQCLCLTAQAWRIKMGLLWKIHTTQQERLEGSRQHQSGAALHLGFLARVLGNWIFGMVNAQPWFWVGGVSRSSKGKSMSVWEVSALQALKYSGFPA